MYLGEPPVGRHEVAIRAGRHVAAGQHVGKELRGRLELEAQDVGKSAVFGFDDGAGVMCDQSAQHGIGVLGVTQVTGAVECVQARRSQVGRVSDVMQPCGGFQEFSVSAQNRCETACPGGDALDMRPAAGQGHLKEYPGELFGP